MTRAAAEPRQSDTKRAQNAQVRVSDPSSEWSGPEKRRCGNPKCGRRFLAVRWWHRYCRPSCRTAAAKIRKEERLIASVQQAMRKQFEKECGDGQHD